MLRLIQLDARGGGDGMENGVLEKQEECEEQRGPRKNLRGKDAAARWWGKGRCSPHQSTRAGLSWSPLSLPTGRPECTLMALGLPRSTCQEHPFSPAPPPEASEPPSRNRLCRRLRSTLRPQSGQMRALPKPWDREGVTGDVSIGAGTRSPLI